MRLWLHSIAFATAYALLPGLLCAPASAESTRLKNVELCNAKDHPSPDAQIAGCTALIESGQETTQTLSIVFNNRGNGYTAKGEYDRAMQDYDQSIKYNRNYATAFNNRGVAYVKRRDYDRALEEFNQAIRLNPNYAMPHLNRAQTLQFRDDYKGAIHDYDEVLRVQPAMQAAFNGRCWSRAMVDVLVPVEADLDRVLAVMGEEAQAVASDPQWADAIVEAPQVLGIESMSADGYTIRVTARTAALQNDPFGRALRARIGARLRREGIALAKPPVVAAPAPAGDQQSSSDA